MSMQDAEAQKQIHQMVNFILNEAQDKAQEIEARAIEDFNIEKLKLLQQMKSKVRKEFQQKAKDLELQRAIARSTAINKSRLKRFSARNVALEKAVENALESLSQLASNAEQYKTLCTDLIVQVITIQKLCIDLNRECQRITQGMLMLLEAQVFVRCRPEDEKVVQACLAPAVKKYKNIVREQTGVAVDCKVAIDTENYLPPGPQTDNDFVNTCSGGVMITNANKKITVDNTLNARLKLVVKERLPNVRRLLFPVASQ